MIKITDKIVTLIPKAEFNGGNGQKFVEWFGRKISTPQNRVIIGATALMTQPFIDLYNNDVDKKTRIASFSRDIGKNTAGMISGYAVRAGLTKLTQNYCKLGDVGNDKIKKLFTPSNASKDLTYAYKQYQNTMGMLLAIVGLLFTNFLFDVPVTNFLTNSIMKKMDKSTDKGVLNDKY